MLNSDYNELRAKIKELESYISKKSIEFQQLSLEQLEKGNELKAQGYHIQHLAYLDIWYRLEKIEELKGSD